MTLADAKAAVRRAFPKLDDAMTIDVLRAVTGLDRFSRITEWGERENLLRDWTPQRLDRAIASTVALFNHNLRPQPKVRRVK